jgi:hypothetical protein
MKRNRGILAVVMATLLVGAFAAPAAAKAGDVVRTGSCSSSAVWKLKGGARDGGIEVEFQVDTTRIGRTWRVKLSDNGTTVFSGWRKTQAPSGSFTVRRIIANQPGTDRIVAYARSVATGQTCSAVIRIG